MRFAEYLENLLEITGIPEIDVTFLIFSLKSEDDTLTRKYYF